ncbi:uncharacterized protein LOC103700165 [Phoenix dactylifera]|uniref:Uncharacterized protein LOC103700165 n=1 Tax=Phoenix dactylifera TaxID=42345 RepID=A0A8B8ZEJ6_PHODC|nr:uncharacterized protein LOC103700165 [Phoenix dactylifera]
MGLKSLSLQMIPWGFHVAGARCRPSGGIRRSPAPVRLIGSDGRVQVYHRPVAAAELMKEYPRHLVCRSDSFFIGQKVPALAACEHLQPGQSYFLLPSHFFHSVLSFVTFASSFTTLNHPNGIKKQAVIRPFDVQKTAEGTLQITVSDEFFLVDKVKQEEEEKNGRGVCTTEALEKEYRRLVRCQSAKWRPKLETIGEAATERRRGGWIRRGVVGFVGLRRRRKKGPHRT